MKEKPLFELISSELWINLYMTTSLPDGVRCFDRFDESEPALQLRRQVPCHCLAAATDACQDGGWRPLFANRRISRRLRWTRRQPERVFLNGLTDARGLRATRSLNRSRPAAPSSQRRRSRPNLNRRRPKNIGRPRKQRRWNTDKSKFQFHAKGTESCLKTTSCLI